LLGPDGGIFGTGAGSTRHYFALEGQTARYKPGGSAAVDGYHISAQAVNSNIPQQRATLEFTPTTETRLQIYSSTSGQNYRLTPNLGLIECESLPVDVYQAGTLVPEPSEDVLDEQVLGGGGVLTIPADLSAYRYLRFEVEDLTLAGERYPLSESVPVPVAANKRVSVYADGIRSAWVRTNAALTTATVGLISFTGTATWRVVGVRRPYAAVRVEDLPAAGVMRRVAGRTASGALNGFTIDMSADIGEWVDGDEVVLKTSLGSLRGLCSGAGSADRDHVTTGGTTYQFRMDFNAGSILGIAGANQGTVEQVVVYRPFAG
jgi:hypothetical protein